MTFNLRDYGAVCSLTLDTTSNRLGVRVNGAWRWAQLT